MMLPPNFGLSQGCVQRRRVAVVFVVVVLGTALTSNPAPAQNRYPTFGLPSSAYTRPPVRHLESVQEATGASHETRSGAVSDAERRDRRRDSNNPRAGLYERTAIAVDPRQQTERHAPLQFPQSVTRGDASHGSDSPESRPHLIGQSADPELAIGPHFPPRQSEDSQAATYQNQSSVRPAPTAQLQQSPPRNVAAVRPTDGREYKQKRTGGHPDRTSGEPAAPVCRPLVEPALFRPETTAMRLISNEEDAGSTPHGIVEATHLFVSTSEDSASAGSKRGASETPAAETPEPSAQDDSESLDFLEFFPSSTKVDSPAPASTRRAAEAEPFDAGSAPPTEDAWDFEEFPLDDPAHSTAHFGDGFKTPAQPVPAPSQPVGPLTEPVLAPPAEEEPWPPFSGEEKWSSREEKWSAAGNPGTDALHRGEPASADDAHSVEIVPVVKGADAAGSSTSKPLTQPATECPFLNGDFPQWMPHAGEPAAAPETLVEPTVHPRRPSGPVSRDEPSAVRPLDELSSGFATSPTPFGPSHAAPPSSSLTGRSRSEEIFKPPRLPDDGFGLRKDAHGDEVSQPTSQNSSRRMRTGASADFAQTDPEISAISESWPEPGPPYSGALFPFLPGQAFAVEERFVDPQESLHIDANALISAGSEPSGADAVSSAGEDGRPVPVLSGTRMQQVVSRDGAGLKGFCPVTLRDEQDLKDGRVAFASSYHGEIYYLASAEAQAAFERNPAKYAPAAHGYDLALAAVTGELREGSLDHAVWYRDRLYLFTSSESLKTFAAAPGAITVTP